MQVVPPRSTFVLLDHILRYAFFLHYSMHPSSFRRSYPSYVLICYAVLFIFLLVGCVSIYAGALCILVLHHDSFRFFGLVMKMFVAGRGRATVGLVVVGRMELFLGTCMEEPMKVCPEVPL